MFYEADNQTSRPTSTIPCMSYSVILCCGCTVGVSCNPITGLAHSRTIERRGSACSVRRHEPGTRVWLWELLPDSTRDAPAAECDDSPDRRVAWQLRRGGDSAWCIVRTLGDRVELHIAMAHDVVMSQRCSNATQASATSNLWRAAMVERGWVDANAPVTLKPKVDRRTGSNRHSA